MINCCIFEDDVVTELFPITETKPIYNCLIGMSSLFDKFYQAFNQSNITLHVRDYLKPTLKEATSNQFPINNINSGSPCLFFNGRVIPTSELVNKIKKIDPQENTIFTYQNHIIVAYLKGELLDIAIHLLSEPLNSSNLLKHIRSKCVVIELEQCYIITQPWDLIYFNTIFLHENDLNNSDKLGVIKGHLSPFTVIYNESNVFIDTQCHIEDFVVIDASKGPVFIESNVTIQSHTRLEGPLYIGKNSSILGGKISCSSISHSCKISGEVFHSIIEAYSNKAHTGFLGHSYLGNWVNLGAGTTTSNLKNTYSPISVIINDQKIPTNKQFLGTIFGDHVKTSVGTQLNSGSIISLGSILFNHPFETKYYPPFSWGSKPKIFFKLDQFIESLERIMKRRDNELSDNYKQLISSLHQQYTQK